MPRELAKSLGIAALIASLATATAFTAYLRYSYANKRQALARQVRSQLAHAPPAALAYDEDLIREFLTRNYAFYGDNAMHKIRGATVVVIGCGGVGSWAALMLLRRQSINIYTCQV